MLAAAAIGAAAAAAAAPRPHLVLMVLDDIGWADLSMRGSSFPTPNLDSLAQGGVLLDRYYVQPVCSPTRSSFMTGRYPFHTGMQHFDTLMPGTEAHLPLDVPTLPELLKETGYETHMVGKWHLGYAKHKYTPVGRGFQTYMGYLQGQVDYYNHTVGVKNTPINGYDFWDNTSGVLEAMWGDDGTYTMGKYVQYAEKVIDNLSPGKSLFLYYTHQEIHIPIEYPPQAKYAELCSKVPKDVPSEMMNRQALCSMISDLDERVGDFVTLLKQKEMWSNTLMFVSTDNGGMTHWAEIWPASTSSNWPLRGGKTTLFEGGVRGTAFVTGGFVPEAARGTVLKDLMHAVDVVPTLAGRGGVSPQASWDGEDMWGRIAGTAPERDTPREIPVNVYDDGKNYSAIIHGDMKLIQGFWGLCDGYWTCTEPYQHVSTKEKALIKLFNLTEDPTETTNLAPSMPDVVADLQKRLLQWADPKNGYLAPQFNLLHPRAIPVLHNGTWAPFQE
eukprot:TRINITY_DN1369_c3_g1_i1.p1 TRINITY_DN1369_c3_g1~~TRINITY_DN1369_c3_g1_i1.p1  ORF type:complete len:525 (+),score=166.56 TRINITY_DN1369_c3_g1_i1:78-1577(+)